MLSSVVSCMIWATENFRHDPVIMPKTLNSGRRSRKLPNPSGRNSRPPTHRNTDRKRVPRRSSYREKIKITRPTAPKDQRTRSAWIYGAICSHRGGWCRLGSSVLNTFGMNLHLQEMSQAIRVALLKGVGRSKNITLRPLPARSPELNPVENIWPFMPDNGLSNTP